MTTPWANGHASSSRGPARFKSHFTLTSQVQELHRALCEHTHAHALLVRHLGRAPFPLSSRAGRWSPPRICPQ